MPETETVREEKEAGPAQALMALATRLPSYLKLAWALGRDPRVPRGDKVWLLGAGLYNLSPLDPIPGIIPVIGQLDDYAIFLLALRRTLSACPKEVAVEHLEAQKLTAAQLQADLDEIRRIAKLIGKKALKGIWTGLRFTAKGVVALGRAGVRAAMERAGSGSPVGKTPPPYPLPETERGSLRRGSLPAGGEREGEVIDELPDVE
jgi:uncharacterized membrane protein YkvA (DUF1232 family)